MIDVVLIIDVSAVWTGMYGRRFTNCLLPEADRGLLTMACRNMIYQNTIFFTGIALNNLQIWQTKRDWCCCIKIISSTIFYKQARIIPILHGVRQTTSTM